MSAPAVRATMIPIHAKQAAQLRALQAQRARLAEQEQVYLTAIVQGFPEEYDGVSWHLHPTEPCMVEALQMPALVKEA